MAEEIKQEDLEKEIEKILKTSDLQKISMKNLRQKLEKKMGVELKSWSSTISKIAMEYVDKMEEEREKAEEEEQKTASTSSESEEDSEKEVKKKPANRRKRKVSGDSDYKEEKPKSKPKKKKSDEDGDKPKGKGTGYTRAYRLSPELAELMGADEMPRHEVVKRVWAIIKEKKLYDPNNKQFAICDDSLYKVIGTKRFRTFGMMKYLKTHFLDD